jgi:hypothetical protein
MCKQPSVFDTSIAHQNCLHYINIIIFIMEYHLLGYYAKLSFLMLQKRGKKKKKKKKKELSYPNSLHQIKALRTHWMDLKVYYP